MEKLVSIIIASYNRQDLVVETLESIEKQTYKNWECIIVDDHSTDNVFEILEDFVSGEEKFKLYRRPDTVAKGANGCRNYGLKISNGHYIKWYDNDDIMTHDHLESLVAHLEENKLDFVVGDCCNFKNELKCLDKPYEFDRNQEITLEKYVWQQIGWITGDFLATRSSIDSLLYNTNLKEGGDEYNFFVRYLHKNVAGGFLNKMISYRRVHTGQLSEKHNRGSLEYLKMVQKIKLETAIDVYSYTTNKIRDYYLSGYLQYSFTLILKKNFPKNFWKGTLVLANHYGPFKYFLILISFVLGLCFGKGYNFLKFVRKNG